MDHQRQKVYNAEGKWRWRSRKAGLADPGETILDHRSLDLSEVKVLYEMLAEEVGVSIPEVVVNPRMKRFSGWYKMGKIDLIPGASAATALHEFAHHMPSSRHNWDFAQNMIRIVSIWYGEESADILKDAYREAGVIWHQDDDIERKARNQKAAERRMDRHGEKGIVYVVRKRTANDWLYACPSVMWHTYYESYAGAWRRRSTAEKRLSRMGWKTGEVVEAIGQYDGYENRWYVKAIADASSSL